MKTRQRNGGYVLFLHKYIYSTTKETHQLLFRAITVK